jgi:aspartyl-tRNA(Asn)/glutamyl-tRNA(Gln) amidotransferase subunit A
MTHECLSRIEQLNPKLNAFITVTADSALAEARQAEEEIQHGRWRGPLHGIPIALKDLVDTAGVRITAASGLFKDRVPTQDAEVVRRLKAAGAVLLGTLNLHEFAYGASSVISYFGPVHNPWDIGYSPRRLFWRVCSRRCGATVLWRYRFRYRRLHPDTGSLLRYRRTQA